MAALITREEHQRRQRRRRRQLIGLAVVVLAFMGIVHLFDMGVDAYRRITDPTERMNHYQSLLRSVVLYDPMTFSGLENANSNFVQETAVWGTIYQLIDKEEWNSLEKSEDERAILPVVDVSAFAAELYGPEVKLAHATFTDDLGLEYVYDEALQGYLVPVTGTEDSYSPSVVDLQLKAGKLRVTVGYLRNSNNGMATNVTTSKPQKYGDYIFERGADRKWYLTGLEESERKAEESDIIRQDSTDLEYDPTGALLEQLQQDETIETENSGTAGESR